MPAVANASQSASLRVRFTPERLGQGTTVEVSAQISSSPGHVPSPLTELDVRYPRELGFAVSGLGLATCSEARLEADGPEACPADSWMGHGSALVEIPTSQEVIQETADLAIVRAPNQGGHLALLFYAIGATPVSAEFAFPGLLLAGPDPNHESIDISVPLVPGLPGSPDVSVVRLHATLGPLGLVYYEHVHGKLVAYKPQGILLPNHCPRGGFAFASELGFQDGGHTSARTTVPCPRVGR
ncbi:MAG: hypothetical protein ACHP93_03340 [Solirubrobacterales bacterium]